LDAYGAILRKRASLTIRTKLALKPRQKYWTIQLKHGNDSINMTVCVESFEINCLIKVKHCLSWYFCPVSVLVYWLSTPVISDHTTSVVHNNIDLHFTS
jgi:hypothetical protein